MSGTVEKDQLCVAIGPMHNRPGVLFQTVRPSLTGCWTEDVTTISCSQQAVCYVFCRQSPLNWPWVGLQYWSRSTWRHVGNHLPCSLGFFSTCRSKGCEWLVWAATCLYNSCLAWLIESAKVGRMSWLREVIKDLLEEGAASSCIKDIGFCKNLAFDFKVQSNYRPVSNLSFD